MFQQRLQQASRMSSALTASRNPFLRTVEACVNLHQCNAHTHVKQLSHIRPTLGFVEVMLRYLEIRSPNDAIRVDRSPVHHS